MGLPPPRQAKFNYFPRLNFRPVHRHGNCARSFCQQSQSQNEQRKSRSRNQTKDNSCHHQKRCDNRKDVIADALFALVLALATFIALLKALPRFPCANFAPTLFQSLQHASLSWLELHGLSKAGVSPSRLYNDFKKLI